MCMKKSIKTTEKKSDDKKKVAKTIMIGIGITKAPRVIVHRFPKNSEDLPKNLKLMDGLSIYAHKVQKFFGSDCDIAVDLDLKKKSINLIIPDEYKASCVAAIINAHPEEVEKSPIKINGVALAKAKKATLCASTVRVALSDNRYFSHITDYNYVDDVTKSKCMRIFCLIKPTDVVIYDDNWGSPYGVSTMTAEQLAKDLLDLQDQIWICTDYEHIRF